MTYTVGRGVRSVIYEGLGDSSDWDENIYAAYANLVRVQSRSRSKRDAGRAH